MAIGNLNIKTKQLHPLEFDSLSTMFPFYGSKKSTTMYFVITGIISYLLEKG